MLTNIFFDLDNTLLDFDGGEAHALSRALRQFGVDPTPAVLDRYHAINLSQWELLEEGKLTKDQVLTRRFDLLFAELGAACDSRAVCDRLRPRRPGAAGGFGTPVQPVLGHQRRGGGPAPPAGGRGHPPVFPEHFHLRGSGLPQAQPRLFPRLFRRHSRV